MTAPTTAPRAGLRGGELALAVLVMAVWGSNFVVVAHALRHLPPLTFAAMRFACVFLPAALFVPRPREVGWRALALYGVLIGAGQFGALFIALRGQVTPGLASLMMQAQVFFTIALSVWRTGERLTRRAVLALALAVAGLGVIAWNGQGSVTALGFALTMVGASCWAGGNIVQREAGARAILPFIVWSAPFAVPPLVLMALVAEGPGAIARGVAGADWGSWAAVAWQAAGNTMFGYGVWNWLLGRHPAATVAPLSLLVPVFGLSSSALLLGEPMPGWKLAAAALVIAGVLLGVLSRTARPARPSAAPAPGASTRAR